MTVWVRHACMVVVVLVCSGCGTGTVDFEARVTLDGKPLEDAAVTLVSSGETRNRTAAGITDAQGSVHFTTFEPGDGVLPGEYIVLVSKSPKSVEEEFSSADITDPEVAARMGARSRGAFVPYTPSSLPRLYLDAAQTPLRCTVPPDDEPVVFALESSLGKRR